MRNMLLVMKREYLERVRKKSFLIMTILVPALMGGGIWIPIQVAMHGAADKRHVAVVAPTEDLANAIKQQLIEPVDDFNPFADADDHAPEKKKPSSYTVDASADLSDAHREALTRAVTSSQLNGFLWITPDALESRKLPYFSKDSSNFSEQESLHSAVRLALTKLSLSQHGLAKQEVDGILKPISIQPKHVERGKDSKTNGFVLFFATLVMVTLLYVTVLIYGMAVMRSVIEEKGSRTIEVMLSSVTPRDLMAGKIVGVGAVGLTQIAIWVILSVAISTPAVAAAKSMGAGVHLAPSTIVYFVVFFLLGYLLYSTLYAGIGAMVNSEQEAQQIQFIVLAPLIFAMIIASSVIQQPGSQLAIWTSMIPFCAPMLMFVRIIVETPPWWQIALCLALMVVTIWGLLLVCARIYRVGILMYGKRPTLPELVKWMKYAG